MEYFPASILKVHDNDTYDVQIDDYVAVGVPASQIRRTTAYHPSELKVGSRIVAKCSGEPRWYPAIFLGMNQDGSYAVQFDGEEFEQKVDYRFVRPWNVV